MNKPINIPLRAEKIGEICRQCRKCCMKFALPTLLSYDKHNKEFFAARGVRLFVVPSNPHCVWAEFDYPCPHLTDSGCAIYKKRPLVCQHYFPTKDEGAMYEICELHKRGYI